MRRSVASAVYFATLLCLLTLRASADGAAEVSAFAPEGTVKDVRQVRATFSVNMIAFGDPRGNGDPFTIDCKPAGHGRWADPKNWVYDFDKDLPAGVACRFTLKPGLKSQSGSPIVGRQQFELDTGGPAVKRSEPWEGSEIDEEQMFVLSLDAPADPATVKRNAYFVVEGVVDRVPVRIIDEDPRKEYAKGGLTSKVKLWAHKFGLPTRIGTRRNNAAQVIVQAKQKFPFNAKVELVWGAGIATVGGAKTTADQSLSFRVRPDFQAEFSCERENAKGACIPISPMSLHFNAPVPWSSARQIRLRAAGGKQWKPLDDKSHPREDEEGILSIQFPAPLPEKTSFQLVLPRRFRDDAGRELFNASRFPLDVATTAFTPLIKFPAEFGILEAKPEAVLPVTVRNVEASLKGAQSLVASQSDHVDGKVLRVGGEDFLTAAAWLKRALHHKRETSIFAVAGGAVTKPLSLPKPNGGEAFEVIGIPLKQPGLYVVELESEKLGAALLGKPAAMYVPTVALVTNLAVHFKEGRESSLAWVTTLDQAKPVAEARISVRSCSGHVLASGVTDEHGLYRIPRQLRETDESCQQGREYSTYDSGLFVVAQKDDDFSFVHSSWHKGIESWRFNFPGGYTLTPDYAATVFDRPLFRAGETVHMKHFFRHHSGTGLALPSDYPKAVQILHQESNQSYQLPLVWRANGVAESTWTIPKGAKLGTYTVTLLAEKSESGDESVKGFHHARPHRRHRAGGSWSSGEFRVEEFRVPLMRGRLTPPPGDLVSPREVPVAVSVEYLSGGPAAKLGLQVRHQFSEAPAIEFPAYDGFTFGNGKVKEPENGSSQDLAPGEEELDVNPETPSTTAGPPGASRASKESLTLDKTGAARALIAVPSKKADTLRNLQIEMNYRDPNGETQTVARSLTIYPAARLLGIKPDSWFATKKSLKFQVAVTDLRGKAVRGAPVEVELVEQRTYSHRKRLVGGLYAYESRGELKRQGRACRGQTDEKGLLSCDTVPPVSGNLLVEAKTIDEAGRAAYANASTWVYDSEEWWFAQDDSDRIDLLPEKKRYEAGEIAVFQARMPFREATALVTVEREGVIDAFVTTLSGKKPLIEIPIQANYAPNVYVSALIVRGRVGEVAPTALVDLGRPAYKLGMSEIHVGWKPHELKVTVQPSKDVYQIREKGRFKVRVQTASGAALPNGAEVALAAVDEGLLQLKPNDSWKLLDAMMRQRGYEVETYTAQSEVIGKRHFGMKALPTGGDGGQAPARQLFDSLLYWNGKVTLDDKGEATIEFPMNDSITGFRIAAIAHAGPALFGTGYATIKTTQELMVLSGVPPLAREGDHLAIELTVRNTTAKSMRLWLTGKSVGPAFAPPDLKLEAGESKVVTWPVDVPAGVTSLTYELSARDRNGAARDHMKVFQKVIPAVPVRVFQATLSQVDGRWQIPVEKPKDATPNRGGVRVVLDSTLLTGLDGVRDFMSEYPYTCIEQRASKAVALRDAKQWRAVADDLPGYLDPDGLARYFPSEWLHGSDILTSYLISLSHEAGWDLPAAPRERMLNGLSLFVTGKITRISDLPTADLTVRKLAALEALSRYDKATWDMTASLQIQPNLWPTSALIDWSLLLRRLKDVPDGEAKRRQADMILRSRLNFQGTMMTFSTENIDELWWMMVSTSTNANRFLLSVVDEPAWNEDMGRVARGAIYRQQHGHWDTTTANAWGVLAVERFAKRFEKTPVGGTTRVTLGSSAPSTLEWGASPKGTAFDLPWPATTAPLAISHSGAGKPWATVQSRAAIPLREPLSSGYRITKTITPVEQKTKGRWSKGDIARVRLEIDAQSDMTWVVVNDPIPAGATILGSGLGNDSSIATTGEKAEGWAEPAFQERAFDGYRAYYSFVPKGKWIAEYTFRFNQTGHMSLPPSRCEAMYAPEMFGELPNADLTIAE